MMNARKISMQNPFSTEEIEEGIDSIMGNRVDEPNDASCYSLETNYWCGNPMGLGIGGRFDFGFRRGGVRAMRHVDEGKWWCFPTVDMHEISPRIKKAPASVSAEKNKKKVEKPPATELPKEDSSLLLKLNHDEVLKSWSDRGSPVFR
ncbi:Protein CHLOROPLAST IMPORT APPARATUS 2 like [Quillaja saponaria]|uniref:Protein CHLOROPLAST IMPORT APPARATUS 2 like n=1 Tax=Quillaja saponaria TaxID=32244 RepID=A0AAD7VKU5_QUISA|nr:Protein CHLOROPLAST IMPORT APPARATUS 2 like [Quillaja saponaria]